MDGLKARLSFDAVAYDYDDEYLTIDTDTHTININNVSRLFGVQYDGNSKLIKFRIRNKLSDIQKMQDSIVYINWIDSRGVKGQSIAINKTINNDTCEFAWKVPFDALKNSGVLHFAMSAVMTKNSSSVIDQRWSTQIASVITPDGIYIKSYTPSSEEEDRIAQIYNELSNMINKQNEALVNQESQLIIGGGRYEYLDISTITEKQCYTGANKTTATEEVEYFTFPPISLKSGTYYFINISVVLSYVTINGITVRISDYEPGYENILNKEFKITLNKNATLYLTGYDRKQYYPHLQNGSIIQTTENGNLYVANIDDNRVITVPWQIGSFNNQNHNTNFFDKDNKYITSIDMIFPYDICVVNADPTKYLYYLAYNVPEGNTDYDNNKVKLIKANTKFRIGVKYQDNRILDINSGTKLIKNSLLLTTYYRFYNDYSDTTTNLIKVGTSGDFNNIQDAINSISDNSESNRYLILVSEGTYDISNAGISYLPIKPYVTIKGVDKSKCIIKFQLQEKDAYKNVFQNSDDYIKGDAEICNFTLITENIKGGLHLDDARWNGKIYFHDIDIDDISGEEVFDESLDYYWYFRTSVGAVNLATHIGQKIVIENVNTNGYIYSHSNTNAINDLDNENGGEFIVRNCICDWIGVYGNGDAVRKNCVIEGNKCQHITISFSNAHNLNFMCWNTKLNNNETDFVAMQYLPYGGANLEHMQNLADSYYGNYPNADPNLHKVVQNKTGSDIPLGTKVKFTDYRNRYIAVTSGEDYDAVTCETIKNNWYGIVQYGGNKAVYLEYLKTHENK